MKTLDGGVIHTLTVSGLAGTLLLLLQVFEPGEFDEGGAALQGVPPHRTPVLMPQPPRPFISTQSLLYFHIVQLDGSIEIKK